MPFAQYHAPSRTRTVRGALPAASSRGPWTEARLVLLAPRLSRHCCSTSPVPHVVCLGLILAPEGRRCRSPGKHRRPWEVSTDSGRASVYVFNRQAGRGTGRFFARRSARACASPFPAPALEHYRVLRPVCERHRVSPRPTRSGGTPRPLGVGGHGATDQEGGASGWTPTTPRSRARDRRVRG